MSVTFMSSTSQTASACADFADSRPRTERVDATRRLLCTVAALVPALFDRPVLRNNLAALPLVDYQEGELILAAGSKTGRLLILKKGAVAIIREGITIANVTKPGAILGEISALLDRPHTADVRALEASQLYVANATTLLMRDPISLLYVATTLAQRLDGTNQVLVDWQKATGRPCPVK